MFDDIVGAVEPVATTVDAVDDAESAGGIGANAADAVVVGGGAVVVVVVVLVGATVVVELVVADAVVVGGAAAVVVVVLAGATVVVVVVVVEVVVVVVVVVVDVDVDVDVVVAVGSGTRSSEALLTIGPRLPSVASPAVPLMCTSTLRIAAHDCHVEFCETWAVTGDVEVSEVDGPFWYILPEHPLLP